MVPFRPKSTIFAHFSPFSANFLLSAPKYLSAPISINKRIVDNNQDFKVKNKKIVQILWRHLDLRFFAISAHFKLAENGIQWDKMNKIVIMWLKWRQSLNLDYSNFHVLIIFYSFFYSNWLVLIDILKQRAPNWLEMV